MKYLFFVLLPFAAFGQLPEIEWRQRAIKCINEPPVEIVYKTKNTRYVTWSSSRPGKFTESGNDSVVYFWLEGHPEIEITATAVGTNGLSAKYRDSLFITPTAQIKFECETRTYLFPPDYTAPVLFRNHSYVPLGMGSIRENRWDYGDGTTESVLGSQITTVHTYRSPGLYTVKLCSITDNDCKSCGEETIEVSWPLGVVENRLEGFQMTPMSTGYRLKADEPFSVDVYDIQGSEVGIFGLSNSHNVGLPLRGIYLLKLTNGSFNAVSKVVY